MLSAAFAKANTPVLNYTTGITASPPVTPHLKQRALEGLQAYGGPQYPGPGKDVYNARAVENGINYERAASDANNAFMLNAQQAQQSAALRGLEQASQGRRNADELATRNQQMMYGYAGDLFGGLNGLLAGLFD